MLLLSAQNLNRCGAAQECAYIRVLEDDGDGRQVVEAEETVDFAFLHMHKTLRTRLLVTLVGYPLIMLVPVHCAHYE